MFQKLIKFIKLPIKFIFFKIKNIIWRLGINLELNNKFFPKYHFKIKRKIIYLNLISNFGENKINPLTHDFMVRFGYLADCLIDVGANHGQFAEHFFKIHGEKPTFLFEPIPEVCLKINKKFSKYSNIYVFEKALSNESIITNFYVANNEGQSSSILKMGNRHKIASPNTKINNHFMLETDTLDNILSKLSFNNSFLKIDVQGNELPVLQGATETLKKVIAIHVEVSTQSLYAGDNIGHEIWKFLEIQGFSLYGIDPWFRDDLNNGELIQADFFFIKKNILNNPLI